MKSNSKENAQIELFRLAVQTLVERGHRVQPALDAPGLFRIDGGPELTAVGIYEAALQTSQEQHSTDAS